MKICAMITLFKPKEEVLRKNLSPISTYAEKIFLLVNDKKLSFQVDDSNVEVIVNGRNIGLSAAFNIALEKAYKEGFDTAVLFDQDSNLSKNNFDILLAEFKNYSLNHKVMCIGPSLNVYGNKLPTPKWTLKDNANKFEDVFSVKNIITSGMILDIKHSLSIGGFESSLPVDFCDYYFCWKSIYNGYLVLKSKNAYIDHEIGKSSMKIGKSVVHFHAPYRNYFLVRDTLRIVFRLKETPLSIRIRYFLFLFPRMILFLIKCDKKKERVKIYCLGFKDFMKHNYGYGSIANLLGADE